MEKETDNIYMGESDPFENLVNAIVYHAVSDARIYYRRMVRTYKQGNPQKSELAYFNLKDVLRWLLSDKYTTITGYTNGALFHDKIMQEISENKETLEIYNMWEDMKCPK